LGQWYSGGTLHKANGLDWQKANARNRLATAADMVNTIVQNGKSKIKPQGIEAIKPYAEKLSICITEATKTKEVYTVSVREIAATCMGIMGY